MHNYCGHYQHLYRHIQAATHYLAIEDNLESTVTTPPQ